MNNWQNICDMRGGRGRACSRRATRGQTREQAADLADRRADKQVSGLLGEQTDKQKYERTRESVDKQVSMQTSTVIDCRARTGNCLLNTIWSVLSHCLFTSLSFDFSLCLTRTGPSTSLGY